MTIDTDALHTQLTTVQSELATMLHQWDVTAPAPAPTPVSTPQPTPAPQPPARGLAAVQRWLGSNTVGGYIGIESVGWRAPQFATQARLWRSFGVDYACVKVGEYGIEWYDGTFAAIRAAFLGAGVGCAPYIFCRPNTWRGDLAVAIKMCSIAGGVILDCEEQFLGNGPALAALVNGLRAACPNACIIVSGYGDPVYAFAHKWPFDAIKAADAYQPQAYFGVWSVYNGDGGRHWQAAIDWSIGQCADDFNRYGIGDSFCIQPAINVAGIHFDDFAPTAAYLKKWATGVTVWEATQINAAIIGQLRKGMGR